MKLFKNQKGKLSTGYPQKKFLVIHKLWITFSSTKERTLDPTLRLYKLKSPVELHYVGSAGPSNWRSPLQTHKVIPRTKEEGYELAAWFLIQGIDAKVEFIDGDRTPIPIEEGELFFLTWKPFQKPEIWIDHKNYALQVLAYPPVESVLQNPSNPPTPL